MGDPTKFQYLYEYYAFNVSLLLLVISEIVIYVYTNFRHQNGKSLRRDFGTKWLLYINFVLCIMVSFLCVSHRAPYIISKVLLPQLFTEIGIAFIIGGIYIRIGAVLTLKKAFTLNVQIGKEQHLVTNGMYRVIRHPAYTGSICSLIGISLALRNIIAVVIVLICCLISYSIRIYVEEKALQVNFGEYQSYKEHTYKMFPYIY